MPTVAISSPTDRLISALPSEPRPSATTLVRPNSRMQKYSGEEKRSANCASGWVSSTMMVADIKPPPSAAISVQPSAFAGLPLRAMV